MSNCIHLISVRKIICVLLLCVLTLSSCLAYASTKGPTCEYNDGGEMRWTSWFVSSEYLYHEVKYENGAYYYYHHYEDTYANGYQCNVNSAHRIQYNTYKVHRVVKQYGGT